MLEIDQWCGRRISKSGITFDDQLIEGITTLGRLVTAQNLQQFIGACIWVRSCIPEFSKEMHPLQCLLSKYISQSKPMKGSALRKYKLDWSDESNQCFERIKCLLSNQVKLSHFDEDKQVCLLRTLVTSSMELC
jgi:hypothetical protein